MKAKAKTNAMCAMFLAVYAEERRVLMSFELRVFEL
jgi:hypothetical protein